MKRLLVRVGRVLLLTAVLGAIGHAALYAVSIRMPGESRRGAPPPPLTPAEAALVGPLREVVEELALEIGERNESHPEALAKAAELVEEGLEDAGLEPRREDLRAGAATFANIVAEVRGGARADEVVVVGAHYDTAWDTPGADDNASGVAALLALARELAKRKPARTIRFIGFANEEPPHFQTDAMGSLVAARRSRERGEKIVAMVSLETIGYYADAPGSQRYPQPFGLFYPSQGDFIAFVGDVGSRALVHRTLATFRRVATIPSEGAALPGIVPGVGWSDHWSYWQAGYPAVMVTDTAPYRNPQYHRAGDVPAKLDYGRMARVVVGVAAVIEDLASAEVVP